MKIRVFKTPSKSSASQVHVGIPDSIKLDPNVSSIEVAQTEILPPPKKLSDLTRTPKVVPNKPLNAFKNVAKSTLEPGFKMTASIKSGKLQPPIEVQEITIPDGFVHLENFSGWHVYNYNKCFKITDENFGTLPGEENLPLRIRYGLFVKGRNIFVKYDDPIDSCEIYYKRIYRDRNLESYWVKLGRYKQGSDPLEFTQDGEFMLRAVPLHEGKPIGGFKQRKVYYKEVEEFDWDIIQLTPDRYQVRMEGILGETINELVVREGDKRVATVKLNPTPEGRIEKSFQVNNVSNDKQIELDFFFYRVNGMFRSFIKKERRTLFSKRADESISLRVSKLDSSTFEVYIEDLNNALYTPINAVSPFDGELWQAAIQSGKMMCQLQIKRHQDGDAYDYGYYTINTTSEIEPKFLLSPPFDKLERINRGYKFIFRDTKTFRELRNLDDPNLEKSLSYEFRLLFWSAGIEYSLRSDVEYSFAKDASVFIKNKRRSYRYNYNTWKEEHPRRKYYDKIPKDLKNTNIYDTVYSSESPYAYLLNSKPIAPVETTNVEIEAKGWEVLYYYNDKDDEIQTFPYYAFDLMIPTTSMRSIDKIEVYIDKTGEANQLLDSYHPTEKINIIDFIGYYDARKIITKTVRSRKAADTQLARRRNIPLPRPKLGKTKNNLRSLVNTAKKKNTARNNNRVLNEAITKTIETGTLLYNIEIIYKDGKRKTLKHSVEISSVPKLPPEPEDNRSTSIGNRTLVQSQQILDKDLVKSLEIDLRTRPPIRKSILGSR